MAGRDNKGLFVKGHKSFVKKGMHKGKRHSPDTEFKRGFTPWNKGNGGEITCLNCAKLFYVPKHKLATRKYCELKCKHAHLKIDPWKNKPERTHSKETRDKISKHQTDNPRRGELAYNWKGGSGTERHQAMGRTEYKQWRVAVFTRDNYTCQICSQYGGYLHADHIETWAENPSLRYDLNNGRTVCRACHYYITFKRKMPVSSSWGLTGLEK